MSMFVKTTRPYAGEKITSTKLSIAKENLANVLKMV